ncbi:MAG: oxidoreductase, partial [Bacteroidaceae bacterium]|nr:oxidoreductase [Bacteroidaceae bacterium]
ECLSQLCAIRRIGHIRIHDIRPGFVRTALLADGKYPLQLDPDKVARNIVKRMLKGESIITVDWRYRLLVGAWRLIPRWIWIKMRISS